MPSTCQNPLCIIYPHICVCAGAQKTCTHIRGQGQSSCTPEHLRWVPVAQHLTEPGTTLQPTGAHWGFISLKTGVCYKLEITSLGSEKSRELII